MFEIEEGEHKFCSQIELYLVNLIFLPIRISLTLNKTAVIFPLCIDYE